MLWAWIPVADEQHPRVVTEQDALEAEDFPVEGGGLWYLAEHTHELLRLARTAHREAFQALGASRSGGLREPARAVGQPDRLVDRPLLERLVPEEELDPPFSDG